uniref:Uncharacterized protein n=1 Tax=Arundo donax TaxID=35708 RepID=A0A0A9B3N1_ARUDO
MSNTVHCVSTEKKRGKTALFMNVATCFDLVGGVARSRQRAGR